MAAHAHRLARLFTPTYASYINAQIIHPARSQVVKLNELQSALARPLQVAHYEPERPAHYLAATLSYGIIQGHPFMDGNKLHKFAERSKVYMLLYSSIIIDLIAFFLGNEYLRAQGLPGLADEGQVDKALEDLLSIADRHVEVAKGKMDVEGLAFGKDQNNYLR